MSFSPEGSPLFLGLVVLFSLGEFAWRKQQKQSYDTAAVGSTVIIAIGQLLGRLPVAGLITAALMGAHALAPISFDMADWQSWVIGFFVVEFFYYWQHRFFHTIRWFWATHSVHHSPSEFTFPAAFRLGWTGSITGSWLFLVPIAVLGIHPVMIGVLYTLNLRYQFFLHTESIGKLGPLEWILNTPSHHRVHHGSNPQYLDKNYGGVLIIFDRLFGSFAEEDERLTIEYGLTDPIRSKNPFVIALREWGRIFQELCSTKSLPQAVHILFGRPGTTYPADKPSAGLIGNSGDLRAR